MKTALPVMAGVGSLVLSAAASAAFTGLVGDTYNVDQGGIIYSVLDVYANFDSDQDVLLNVFNTNLTNLAWVHDDFLADNWNPNLALSAIDSWVAVGGSWGAGDNTTSGDPNFNGLNGQDIPVNAGWFNSSPPNLQGQAGTPSFVNPNTPTDGFFTIIGRFVIAEVTSPTSLDIQSLSLTWNQGIGTPSQQATITDVSLAYIPAPGALALLGLAGLAGSRRRRA